MDKIKSCPFCGGNGKVSFKDYRFIGKNYCGQKKLIYRVQVICNRCRSRGKPIITDVLVNPNPYISEWGNCGDGKTTEKGKRESDIFRQYVEEAVKAWNTRDVGGDNDAAD